MNANKHIKTKNESNRLLKKFISLAVSAVLILSAFLPVALSPVVSEAVVRNISLENSYEDSLTSVTSSNQYYFEITSRGSVMIKFETPAATKTSSWRVSLVDISDAKVYPVKDFGGGEVPGSASTRVEYSDRIRLPAGNYYVNVSVPEGYAVVTGTYKISVSFIPESDGSYETEPNNTTETATPLTTNAAVTGNISYKGDIDYFRISLPATGSLILSFSAASSIETGNWTVLLYDKNEKLLQMERVGLGGEVNGLARTNKLGKVRLPAGIYYIKVAAYSDILSSSAEYKIFAAYTPERSAKFEKEFNDTAETATNLLINAPVTGNMSNADDRDYFKFTVAEYRDLKIKFSTPDAINQNMWTIYLQDSKGGVVTYYAGQTGTVENGARIFSSPDLNLDPGLYHIVIFPYTSPAGAAFYSNADYILTVCSDLAPIPIIYDDDIIDYPTEIPTVAHNVNKDLEGNIKSAADSNIFDFGLNYSGSISVDFQSPQSVIKQAWILNIYDKNDRLICSGKYGDEGQTGLLSGMKVKTSDRVRVPAGSYYVKVLPVNSYDFSLSAYRIKINYFPEAKEALNSDKELYETEYNNAPLTANALTLGNALKGNLSDYTDIDYFKFTVSKSSGVRISFSSPAAVTQNDWAIEVFTSDFAASAIYKDYYGADGISDGAYSDYKTTVSKILRLPPGTYYLRVGAYNIINYSNEDYVIKAEIAEENLSGVLYETEPNNTPAAANILPLNTDITGNIFDITDIDFYKISIGKEKTIQFKFSVNFKISSNLWSIKLYDGSGKELKTYRVGGEGGAVLPNGLKYFKTEKIPLVPGDYYICILPVSKTEFSNEDYVLKALDEAGQKIDTYVYSADKPSDWAMYEVEFAYGYDLVPQSYMRNFKDPIKREEFCMLAIRMLEAAENKPVAEILAERSKTINYYAFTDTNDLYILSANALGIVNGRGGGIFDPGGNITREEAATMLMRLGALENMSLNMHPLSFKDASTFNTWSADAILYVSGCMDSRGNRVMNGYTDGGFHPKDTYSREQAFMTIFRLFAIKTKV